MSEDVRLADYERIHELRSMLQTICERIGFQVTAFKVEEYPQNDMDFGSYPEIEIQLRQVEKP